MASATPTRRALLDLPVNTFGAPSTMSAMGKEPTSHKRPIHEVEEPEFARPRSRVRTSAARSVFKDAETEYDTSSSTPFAVACPTSGSTSKHSVATHTPETTEAVGDGDSQKDSMSSLIDFDPDDTMASQQTAATELTQPSPTRARRHAETLRLRLRLAHFKVQTNQTNVPLSQLQLSGTGVLERLPSPVSPDARSQSLSLPRLLPAAVLQISSSPHSSADKSPARYLREEAFRTPALPRHRAHASLQLINSPPASQKRRKEYNEEESMTSSALRGKAAIGLLGLREER